MLLSEYKTVFEIHCKRYPLMLPEDAVKLLFQSEFGGGHLITNKQACYDYLRAEYLSALGTNPLSPPFEYIGNGIYRVNFGAIDGSVYDCDKIFDDFTASAELILGSLDSFYNKLDMLFELTQEGLFAFDCDSLEKYIIAYKNAGCPPVSHSLSYKKEYRPSYRIVCSDFLKKRELI